MSWKDDVARPQRFSAINGMVSESYAGASPMDSDR